jgi:tripartite-type tricarboxylate transporter receptor subunit TctC
MNLRGFAIAAAALAGAAAHAETWPVRPVRVIVNVAAGGGVDTLARLCAQHYAAVWAQPFVVDNRAGAGGNIGAELVAKAAPDGYTLLVSSATVVTNAATRAQAYDPVRDFAPVTKLTANPYIIVVTPALPARTVPELAALAKARAGGLTFASAGTGSILHMGGELLALMTGAPMTHVPYKGVAEAYPAVASGQVDWMLGSPISALPLIKAGRLRGIAVTSPQRSRALPDLPAVAESVPGYEVVAWFGMFAPAHTPREVVAKLNAEAKRALATPEVARRMEIEGTDVVVNAPPEFALQVKAEYDKWRGLVAKTGMKF